MDDLELIRRLGNIVADQSQPDEARLYAGRRLWEIRLGLEEGGLLSDWDEGESLDWP